MVSRRPRPSMLSLLEDDPLKLSRPYDKYILKCTLVQADAECIDAREEK
jgi:hypothetical protein